METKETTNNVTSGHSLDSNFYHCKDTKLWKLLKFSTVIQNKNTLKFLLAYMGGVLVTPIPHPY